MCSQMKLCYGVLLDGQSQAFAESFAVAQSFAVTQPFAVAESVAFAFTAAHESSFSQAKSQSALRAAIPNHALRARPT